MLDEADALLKTEKDLSPAIKSMMTMLLLVIRLLLNRLGINSENSTTPPSQDLNRKRGSKRTKSQKKPGGQAGHVGACLEPIENSDRIEEILVDRSQLPKGKYHAVYLSQYQLLPYERVCDYFAQQMHLPFSAGTLFNFNWCRLPTIWRRMICV